MKSVLISEFKTHCVGLLKEVELGRKEILVTRRGRPLAKVSPADPPTCVVRKAADAKGIARIVGDIVEGDQSDEWEALSK
jgi:prevent-host-death family protein